MRNIDQSMHATDTTSAYCFNNSDPSANDGRFDSTKTSSTLFTTRSTNASTSSITVAPFLRFFFALCSLSLRICSVAFCSDTGMRSFHKSGSQTAFTRAGVNHTKVITWPYHAPQKFDSLLQLQKPTSGKKE